VGFAKQRREPKTAYHKTANATQSGVDKLTDKHQPPADGSPR